MRLEELEILSDCWQDLIIFGFLLQILGNMQNVGFLISQNFSWSRNHSNLGASRLSLSIFWDSWNQALLFGIFVYFIFNLPDNIIDFGAELIEQIIWL